MKLFENIVNTIKRYDMIKKGDRVLVAVSGGPDSVFLAHFLNNFKAKLGIKLFIAHLDHGLRGAQSRADAVFVKKLAGKLDIKYAHATLRGAKKKGALSLEEFLRKERYSFLRSAAKKFKARSIATAHTLDDQAETVMMRIIKGASLKGAVGIHPVRVDGDIRIIRPLISTEKKDILCHLKAHKITFRLDRTNLENDFLRNRVRNRVLPYIARINPRIKRSLSNLAESLREDYDFIESAMAGNKRPGRSSGKGYEVALAEMLIQPRALRKEITREALRIAGGNIKKLTFRHWKDMDNFIVKSASGKSLDLPGGIKMRKTRDSLIFSA